MYVYTSNNSCAPAGDAGPPRTLPVFGHFRDLHFVRSVMEAKQFLLRCVCGLSGARPRTPDVILVDAGARNLDIKAELERWMEAHPQLGRVKVQLSPGLSWIRRRWRECIRREGTTAKSA